MKKVNKHGCSILVNFIRRACVCVLAFVEMYVHIQSYRYRPLIFNLHEDSMVHERGLAVLRAYKSTENENDFGLTWRRRIGKLMLILVLIV